MHKRFCVSCQTEKSIDDFRAYGRNRDKYGNKCKACNYEVFKKWRYDNSDRLAANRPEWTFERRCKRHKVSPEVVKHTYEEQKGKCVICIEDIQLETCAIDHNHVTREFRGLLCKNCNSSLGFLKDNPENAQRALDYLKERGHYGEG